MSVLNSDPSLKKLFNQAVNNQWAPARFVAELRNTDWFKQHGESLRKAAILRKTDPATWEADVNKSRALVRDMATKLGAQLSDATLTRIATNVLKFGWNDSQIQDTLAGSIKMGSADTYGGQAAVNADTLKSLAYNNGIQLDDKTLRNWLVRIGAGEDIGGFQDYIRGMAKSAFPGYDAQIDAGQNVSDIASPYINAKAQILELDPSSIDLFDPTIRQALQTVDPATGKVTQQPLYQFERQVRQDPRWLQTDNAQASLASKAHNVLSSFGLVS